MKIVTYSDYESLANSMIYLSCECGLETTAALLFEDAEMLARELLKFEGVEIGYFNLVPPEYDGYDKEYYISLDSDLCLYVEEAWSEKLCGYADATAAILFLSEEVNSKIEKYNKDSIAFELRVEDYAFDDDDYADDDLDCLCDEDCDKCPFADEKDAEDDVRMSDEEVVEALEEIAKILEEFKQECKKHGLV